MAGRWLVQSVSDHVRRKEESEGTRQNEEKRKRRESGNQMMR